MGNSPGGGGLSRPADRLIGRLTEEGAGRAESLTASFVLRTRDGRVSTDAESTDFARLVEALTVGQLEDAGGGYHVAVANDRAPAWLLRLRGEQLAAAFEFATPDEASEAVPRFNRSQSDVELVRESIWAFVERDVSALLRILAEDFSYTDLHFGGSIQGASTVVSQILLSHEELQERGLAGLELRELPGGLVEASGTLKRGANGSGGEWIWTVITGVEDGRIAWSVRRPDRQADD